jgi:hypothetical protein
LFIFYTYVKIEKTAVNQLDKKGYHLKMGRKKNQKKKSPVKEPVVLPIAEPIAPIEESNSWRELSLDEDAALIKIDDVRGIANHDPDDQFEWGRTALFEFDSNESAHASMKQIKKKYGHRVTILRQGTSLHLWKYVPCKGCWKMCDLHTDPRDKYGHGGEPTFHHSQGFCTEQCYKTKRTCAKRHGNHTCSTCVDQKCNAQRMCHCRICGGHLDEPTCSTRHIVPEYDRFAPEGTCICSPSHEFKGGNGEKCTRETETPNGVTQCNGQINDHPGVHDDYWCPCSFKKHCRVCGGLIYY